jgi:hypothetical protein
MFKLNILILISGLMHAFGCVYNCVKQILAHGLKPPESRRHHLALPSDIKYQCLEWIEQNAAKSTAMTG